MDTITATIDDSEAPQSLQELTHFFLLLRAMTAVARHFDQLSIQDTVAECDTIRATLHEFFEASKLQSPVSDFFFTALGHDEPQIVSIVKQSPLEIVLAGSLPLLIFALVISGGEISYASGKLRVKLPPLGTGIKKLIEAFALEDRSREARVEAMHIAKESLKTRTLRATPSAAQPPSKATQVTQPFRAASPPSPSP